mmetsp:Transcript_45153/g.127722  ORF Transcript_45153/g.127722 Transcript_45153/m.127722 type:complete len:255 (+) Transcript_45153:440-1204(+)
MCRTYLVLMRYLSDARSSMAFSTPSNCRRCTKGFSCPSSTRRRVSDGTSPSRIFVPGRAQAGRMLPSNVILPSCAKTRPMPSVMRMATTATRRRISPVFVTTRVLFPSRTSCSSLLALQAQDQCPIHCCRFKVPTPTKPTKACMCLGAASTMSSNSVSGTCRSVGHVDSGGHAAARRAWNETAYSCASSWLRGFLARTSAHLSAWIMSSSHGVEASTVPTVVHVHQSAASQIHWPSDTRVTVVSSTCDESGLWV